MRAPLYGSGGDGGIYPLTPRRTLAAVQLSSCDQFMIYIIKLARSVLDVTCSVSKSQVYAGPALSGGAGGIYPLAPHGTLAAVQLSSCDHVHDLQYQS
jgi:hypothetical protein